jgi:cation transport regulator ChaC
LLGCKGARGPNCEYAINTYKSLEALGVHDAHLAKLVASCT